MTEPLNYEIWEELREINGKLSRALKMLALIVIEEEEIMATVQDLQDEVANETTVDAGLVKIITALQANQNDPAKLDAILANMKQNSASLSAALVSGTVTTAPVQPIPDVSNPAPV